VAEGAPLLRAYTWKRIEGSNPSLSAIYLLTSPSLTTVFHSTAVKNSHTGTTLGLDSQPLHLQNAQSSTLVASLVFAILSELYLRFVTAKKHKQSLNLKFTSWIAPDLLTHTVRVPRC
jgi:hypothetical protein